MYELNFRSEFVTLDHFMFDWAGQLKLDVDERETPASRRAELVRLMHDWDGDIIVEDGAFEYFPSGLAGCDRRTRILSMVRFWGVMKEWVGVGQVSASKQVEITDRLISIYRRMEECPLKEILDTEEACWRHYIRTFYRVFGRPPTLPRCMPCLPGEDATLV